MWNELLISRSQSRTSDDAIVTMLNKIATKLYKSDECKSMKGNIELIGSMADRILNNQIFKFNRCYLLEEDYEEKRAFRVTHRPQLLLVNDIDIRVPNIDIAQSMVQELRSMAMTTGIFDVTRLQSVGKYGMTGCLRVHLHIACAVEQTIDISFPKKGVYALEDFFVKARVPLGYRTLKPYLMGEFITQQCRHPELWKLWISRNNLLVIPSVEEWADVRQNYPKSPSYMDMLFNQFRRWNKCHRRLTPHRADTTNRQEYLKNMCNRFVTAGPARLIATTYHGTDEYEGLRIYCHHCDRYTLLHSLIQNRNLFARHILVRNQGVYFRCHNTHLHPEGPTRPFWAGYKDQTTLMFRTQLDYQYPEYFQCGICFTSMVDCQLVCGHMFCSTCLDTWEAAQNQHTTTCPECKQGLVRARVLVGDRIQSSIIEDDSTIPMFEKNERLTKRPPMTQFPDNFHLAKANPPKSQPTNTVDLLLFNLNINGDGYCPVP